ncbi:MAG: hypothetical protein R2737_03610 [Candidatus Nanopelagicales bacterium]
MTTPPTRPLVGFATCAEVPDLEDDDRLPIPYLEAMGVDVEPAVWDDPEVDWTAYDLVVVRETWDYPRRRDAFLAWARSVPRLANPADVLAWNTDKTYLGDLAARGIPVVRSDFLAPGDQARVESALARPGEHVVKPSVGAGSVDALRCDLSDPAQAATARAHARRLLGEGRTVLVQPYLEDVDHHGETALLYVDGRFSHAIRKGPLLTGPHDLVEGLYKQEEIEARSPSPAERALADRVVAEVPGVAGLLYARVDLLPGPDGTPQLLELELAEPSLFLGFSDGAPRRLAEAIAARVGVGRGR